MKSLFRLVAFLAVVSPSALLAQDTSYQAKTVFHPTIDLNKHWFAAGWIIGNMKTDSPDNLNLFGGIGYRGRDWTLEMLYQKQFSKKNSSALDFRLTKALTKRDSLYVEAAPSLTTRSVYNAVFVERRIAGNFSAGGEMENNFRRGAPDTVEAGVCASYVLGTFGPAKVVARATYMFGLTPGSPNVLRFSAVVHARFRKHH